MKSGFEVSTLRNWALRKCTWRVKHLWPDPPHSSWCLLVSCPGVSWNFRCFNIFLYWVLFWTLVLETRNCAGDQRPDARNPGTLEPRWGIDWEEQQMCEPKRSQCDGEQQVSRKLPLEQLGAAELAWNGLGVPGRQPFLYIFQAYYYVSICGSIIFVLFWFLVFLFWCRSSGYLSQVYLEPMGI